VRLSAEKVVSTGFTFNFPELKGALANVIEQGL
jgi:NAD dependent epimerase/dehydratase family enzyme